jgi:peptidyl-prolyl cis-trans isomerase B (cyclophilin B)
MRLKKLFKAALMACLLGITAVGTGCSGPKYPDVNPFVTIEMDDGKKIVIELYADVAPNTVANFVTLAQSGFYDGTVFHRIVPKFVIQGGSPDGTGSGGPGYGIKGDFSQNGVKNDLSHQRGVISMARSQHPDSAGSQFFIVVDDRAIPSLDNMYAGFGKVTEGMDVVDEIVSGPNSGAASMNMALEPRVMAKVTVDTKGEEWPEPVKTEER